MPTYLLHGFRWPRPLVRIHIILQNIDDAAAEWLCAPTTTAALLDNFEELWPDAMSHLPNLRFIEQYDPNDERATAASQPFAYVADVVEEINLSIDVDEVRGKGLGNDQWGALMEIRDKLAPDEKVGWYVVVCGDEERWAPPTVDLLRGGIPREGFNGVQINEAAVAHHRSETASSGSSDAYRTGSRSDALASGVSAMSLDPRAPTSSPETVKKERGSVKKWLSRRKR